MAQRRFSYGPWAFVAAGLALGAGLVTSAPEPAEARSAKVKPAPELMRIHVLNVGQGDATVIEGPADANGDRRVLVVDTGESPKKGNEAKHVVEPYMRAWLDDGPPTRPVVDVDYFIPTHYHYDHMGGTRGDEGTGMYHMYESIGVRIGLILDTGVDYDASGMGDKNYRSWVKEKQPRREKLRFDQQGDDRQIDLGEGVWVEVLAVAAEVEGRGRVVKDKWISTTSQNDFSAAIVVHYGKFDFYVAGDLSGYLHESWGAWYHPIEAATYPHLRPTEVYRVNHHGSQWSSNYPFLQRLKPKVALISCGKGHHHPNEFTVRRLLGWEDYWTGRPMGSEIFQTKADDGYTFEGQHPHTLKQQRIANGHILIESDGEEIFTVTIPGQEPFTFPLDEIPAYTEPPYSVIKARREHLQLGAAGDGDRFNKMDDADDVEAGSISVPRNDDPEGGGD
jgi:beta-lactamase superfamily II metal-dependent hydrolase